MPKAIIKHSSDLLGVGRLTIDAIAGVTDIAEGLHHAIVNVGGILDAPPDDAAFDRRAPSPVRTRGITGLVYRSIRGINGMVGLGLDALIRHLTSTIGEQELSPNRDAVVSALNGVLGDHLARTQNPLAITMRLRRDGKFLSPGDYADVMKQANGRVALFVHGLCMGDTQWRRRGHDHGEALARDLGLTPIYLRYNTGLHISENGRQLAELLNLLTTQSPCPPELHIVAHSMGGLVSRSAYYYAELSAQAWTTQLRKLVFLGTPHHGALLERGGNWIDVILDSNPFSAPFSRLGKIRSCGITDLRYGNVIDEDWQGTDRFHRAGDLRKLISLPKKVPCYAIAATTLGDVENFSDDLLGDGLVTVESAFGEHRNSQLDLGFASTNRWLGRGINHMDLLNAPDVYHVLLDFVARDERVTP